MPYTCLYEAISKSMRTESIAKYKLRTISTPRESPWYLWDRRLGGTQSRSRRGGEEKNSRSLLGMEPQILQHVAQRYSR
jgi:hypothetical protein